MKDRLPLNTKCLQSEQYAVVDKEGYLVETLGVSKQHSEFIVKACNNYHKLVEALEKIIEHKYEHDKILIYAERALREVKHG